MMAGKDIWRERLRRAMLERRTSQRRALQSNSRAANRDTALRTNVADDVDRASEDAAGSLAAGLAEIKSGQLVQIEEALRRLRNGTYGRCLDCGKPIPKARLQMVLFAIRCVGCQRTCDSRRAFRSQGAPTPDLGSHCG